MNTKALALIGVALAALGACSKKPAASGATTSASSTTTSTTASAPAAQAQHVRGVLEQVSPTTLVVRGYDGQPATATVDATTGYAWVEPSSLSSVKDGDFIGTATTGPDSALRAVEVVIFPASMRGTGEGHYGWDTPGAIAANGQTGAGATSGMTNGTVQQSGMTNGTVQQSGMTNGTVQQSGMTNGTVQQSGMTNGTVQQSGMTNGTVSGGAGSAGGKTLTVAYKGGSAQVLVPEGAPVVRFEPTKAASAAKGQKVFIVVPPGGGAAKFVAIGKDGLTPPM